MLKFIIIEGLNDGLFFISDGEDNLERREWCMYVCMYIRMYLYV